MSNKKILCTIGSEFNGECFVRIDIKRNEYEKNKWFYFQAQQSDEMIPYYGMEILDNDMNRATLRQLIKELIDDKIQDNPERP